MKRRDVMAALPEGYGLIPLRSGHLGITRPDGERLRSATGLPLCVSLTPSDWRSSQNELARIRRALSATADTTATSVAGGGS
jgi:hypothetical protein